MVAVECDGLCVGELLREMGQSVPHMRRGAPKAVDEAFHLRDGVGVGIGLGRATTCGRFYETFG